MKKSHLLSGIIALSTIMSLNAMESRRKNIRPVEWKKLDEYMYEDTVDWGNVFNTLTHYSYYPTLVDEYRDLNYEESLLELAIEFNKEGELEILLRYFHANPNAQNEKGINPILHEAKHVNKNLVEILKTYGALDE